MSADVTAQLQRFEKAVANEEFGQAEQTLEELEKTYNELLITEEVRVAKTISARDELDLSSEKRAILQDYISEASAVALARTGFLTTSAAYLSDPTAVSDDELLEVTQQLQTREAGLTDAATSSSDILNSVTLPPNPVIAGTNLPEPPYLKGQNVNASVVISNTGNESVTDISLSVESSSPLEVSPGEITINSIEGGQEYQDVISFSLTEPGEFSATFELESDAGGETEILELEVESKQTLISTVLEAFTDLRDEAESTDGLPGKSVNGLLAKIDSAEQKVTQAEDRLSNGKVEQTNDALTASANILGAFLNQLTKGSNGGKGNGKSSGLSPVRRKTLSRIAERIIDLLAAAKRAEA